MAIEEVRKNKSAKRPNFHKGSLSHSPSQTNGDAKVQINSEIAIPKLQKLAETYFGVSDPSGAQRGQAPLRPFIVANGVYSPKFIFPCIIITWFLVFCIHILHYCKSLRY